MMQLNTGLQGEFRLVVTHPDGTEQDTGWFPNLILNQGLDRLGIAGSILIQYAQVGAGTGTPIATQTSLESYVAGANSNPTNYAETCINEGAPTYAALHTWRYTFTQGSVIGNITEIGVGWGATGATLFSRALILDGVGSPTTITLVAIDQLTVYYRLRVFPPLGDATGILNISGTDYSYVVRVSNASNFATVQFLFNSADNFSKSDNTTSGFASYGAGSVLGSINGTPTLQSGSGGPSTTAAYTLGTYYRDTTFSFGVGQGNATGGIGALRFVWPQSYSVMPFQMSLSPVLPKDNTKTFSITMRFSWNRV